MLTRLFLATGLLMLLLPLPSLASTIGAQPLSKGESSQIPSGTADPNYSVVTWAPKQTWNGTTFFGNSQTGQIVEVNMKGEVVFRYQFPNGGTIHPSVGGVMVVPVSNDILFSVINPESVRGAYEVNIQGQLVWSYVNKTVSHDAVRLPSGDTLITAGHAEDYSNWPYTQAEVIEVNPQGQIVWAWHAKQDYANNPAYANIRSTDFGYWTHTNDALRLPDGTTMVSLRNFNLTAIVNPSGKGLMQFDDPCVFGCAKGYVVEPHSPLPLANGNYLISEPTTSRSVEFNPSTQRVVWQWPQGGKLSGTNLFVRASQRLPNGNTLVTDSNGQIFEVTSGGQVVWQLRCECIIPYQQGTRQPFFAAERLSYMPPSFVVSSPVQHGSYPSNNVPVTITLGADLGNMTYSIRSNQNNTWIVRNATLIQNVFKDSLDPPKTTNGPSSLSLPVGNYTLRIFASSTGYGYKAFVDQKRVNYVSQDITFNVTTPASSTSTTTNTQLSSVATSSTATTTTTAVPEFPLSPVAVLVGSLLVAVAVLSRFGRRLPS
jgi:hypothetical protein